tara:strand:- start:172 stop:1248 length:1077 start_codon:yes stop_codon:yes gene_type:complete
MLFINICTQIFNLILNQVNFIKQIYLKESKHSSSMDSLVEKIKKFEKKKIAVIGDLFLDKYTGGSTTRFCPEAIPAPVVKVKEDTCNPGGAGNTAVNLASLGSQVYLIGVIGGDNYGNELASSFDKYGLDVSTTMREGQTIIKQRIVSEGRIIARLDHNEEESLNKDYSEYILASLQSTDSLDACVISDYGKGTLNESSIRGIIDYCNRKKITLVVDPKPKHAFWYSGATIITPNFSEACLMAGKNEEHFPLSIDNGNELASGLNKTLNSSILLTLSQEGMIYNDKKNEHFPTHKREVWDVSGAGDTVVAALAFGIANGLEVHDSIIFANHAAGVAVGKSQVQPISLEEIIEDIHHYQ